MKQKTINIIGHKIRISEVDKVSASIEDIDGEFIQCMTSDPDPKYFGIIRVDKSLPEKQKRRVVLHELIHALNDMLWHEADL